MSVFKRLGTKLKELSPAAIREIIAAIIILCLAIALSFPQYKQDREKAKLQKETQKVHTFFDSSTPQLQGMDSAMLEEASGFLKNTSALSLIVIRNSKVVCEKYYRDEASTNIFSITKSIISALTGIAIREGCR